MGGGIKMILEKIISKLLLAGTLAFSPLITGCEEGPEPNDDQGVDNFYIRTETYIMGNRQSVEKTAQVKKDCEYDIWMLISNDGPTDIVSISVDDNELGRIRSPAVSAGGDGWYMGEYSQKFRFTPTNDIITLKAKVESADSYGVWPSRFYLSRVMEEKK